MRLIALSSPGGNVFDSLAAISQLHIRSPRTGWVEQVEIFQYTLTNHSGP